MKRQEILEKLQKLIKLSRGDLNKMEKNNSQQIQSKYHLSNKAAVASQNIKTYREMLNRNIQPNK